MGAAPDSRDAGSELTQQLHSPPPGADSWLASAVLPSLPDFLPKLGVRDASSARRGASDPTGGDFSLCSVLPESCCAAMVGSHPGPRKAGSVRSEERQKLGPQSRGPRLEAEMQFAES